MNHDTANWLLSLTKAQRESVIRNAKTLVTIGIVSTRIDGVEMIFASWTARTGRFESIRNRA